MNPQITDSNNPENVAGLSPSTPTVNGRLVIENVLKQEELITPKQRVLRTVITLLGLCMVLLAIYFVKDIRTSATPGFILGTFGIQTILGIGFILRKEAVRWLIMIFYVLVVIFNVLPLFYVGLAWLTNVDNLALLALFIVNTLVVVIPIAIIFVLNLKSVKNAFH